MLRRHRHTASSRHSKSVYSSFCFLGGITMASLWAVPYEKKTERQVTSAFQCRTRCRPWYDHTITRCFLPDCPVPRSASYTPHLASPPHTHTHTHTLSLSLSPSSRSCCCCCCRAGHSPERAGVQDCKSSVLSQSHLGDSGLNSDSRLANRTVVTECPTFAQQILAQGLHAPVTFSTAFSNTP